MVAEGRRMLEADLEVLSAGILRLGALSCEFVPRGTEVLLTGDLGAAQELIDADDEVDRLAVEMEELAFHVLALRAPVATDLRYLLAAIKIIAELERSADLMVNIAKGSRRLHGAPPSARVRGVISEMSAEAHQLLRSSMDAFADGDAALAAALDDIDDLLDELNRSMVAAIFAAHGDGELDLGAAVQLALIARYYERIGDHAVNIGERIRFWRTGWTPEHTGAARARSRESGQGTTESP